MKTFKFKVIETGRIIEVSGYNLVQAEVDAHFAAHGKKIELVKKDR